MPGSRRKATGSEGISILWRGLKEFKNTDRLAPNSDLQTIGTKHVAFAIPDMKRQKDKFLANGVDIAHEVVMEGSNVMFVRDNSGVLIEFIEKK